MKVVVVGSGAIGLGIAWRSAAAGLDVTVIDPDPQRAAAQVAAGMLCPVSEASFGEEDLLALGLASVTRYPAFVAELAEASGRDPGYIECGSIAPARDGDDLAAIDRMIEFQTELGLSVQRLTSRQARQVEPALARTVRGGARIDGDHQIDNRLLLAALSTACCRAGVTFVAEAAVEASGRGVVTSNGANPEKRTNHAADAVVLAGGAWTGGIDLGPDIAAPNPPLRPVKGQIIRLRANDRMIAPSRIIRGVDVYLAPRPSGEIVVGASVEDLGFDDTVTAGAVFELLRDAWELVPSVAEMELVETSVGFRPGSPDNAPLIGMLAPEGPIVAAGHYRNGILLTPVTADAVVALLVDGELPPVAAAFAPDRFERTHP